MSTTAYDAEVRHDGRLYTFSISELKIPICQACGEKVFTEDVDRQVNDALRAHLHMLTPATIDEGIRRVGMTQKEFARRLGVAEATLSRWLNEIQIQSRAMDNLLRVFLAFPQVRAVLDGVEQNYQLGTSDVIIRTYDDQSSCDVDGRAAMDHSSLTPPRPESEVVPNV